MLHLAGTFFFADDKHYRTIDLDIAVVFKEPGKSNAKQVTQLFLIVVRVHLKHILIRSLSPCYLLGNCLAQRFVRIAGRHPLDLLKPPLVRLGIIFLSKWRAVY